MKYELLLFDADGTLFDYTRAESWSLEQAFSKQNLPYSQTTLKQYGNINYKIWQEFEQGLISPTELQVERFRRLASSLAIDTDPTALSDSYLEALARAGFLLPGAEELLAELSTTHTLALITNGLEAVQWGRLAVSGIRSYFSQITISESVGYQKPDPRIFDVLFQDLGWQNRRSSLIIGDSLTSDMPGGIAAGIDTCWYNPGLKKTAPEDLDITYTIADLSELPAIVQ